MRNLDTFRGCMLGGAAGDALGYAVEFHREYQIFNTYGPGGIRDYVLNHDGVAEISDDTQMTLFTANGLLYGSTRSHLQKSSTTYIDDINSSYLDWYKTQTSYTGHITDDKHIPISWLTQVPAIYHRRAPGTTCMAALRAGGNGTPDNPLNNSKGCGGIMRVAPIGLFFADRDVPAGFVPQLGAQAAALTHGHPLGWLPAAVFVQILLDLTQDGLSVEDAVCHALDCMDEIWPETQERLYLRRLTELALNLAGHYMNDLDAIHQLGEGWVAEETLAIGVYCAAKYEDDFDAAIIAAVNHNGDSDSTGSVAGNILGARLGLQGIPEKYQQNLELRDVILEIADDLHRDCPMTTWGDGSDPAWEKKYVEISWPRMA